MDIPVLHWGGWYDVFLEGTIDWWKGVRAANPAAPSQHLVIAPTDHELTPDSSGRVGRMEVNGHGFAHDRVLAWMDRWLKGHEAAGPRAAVEVSAKTRSAARPRRRSSTTRPARRASPCRSSNGRRCGGDPVQQPPDGSPSAVHPS